MTQCGLVTASRDVDGSSGEFDTVGSIADEATRLLDALGVSAPQSFAAAFESAPSAGEPDRHERDVVCQWCPVCRVVRLVREASPETVESLAHLATSLAQTLADLAESRRDSSGTADTPDSPHSPQTRHDPSAGAESAAGSSTTSTARPGGAVHDIPVTDDEDDD